MKFCVKCGYEFKEGEQFCSRCGLKRDSVPGAQANGNGDMSANQNQNSPAPTNPNSNKPKKKKTGLIIVIALIVVLAAGGFLLWQNGVFDSLFGKKDDTEITNDQPDNSGETNQPVEDEQNNAPEPEEHIRPVVSIEDAEELKYSIHTAKLEENVITTKVSTEGSASVMAQIYSDDLKDLLETQQLEVPAGADAKELELNFKTEIPERFGYIVRIVDSAGEDLCAPYIDVKNTSAFERMMAKKTDDFPAEKVIVMDGGENGGFLVIDEDVTILKNGENATFASYDEAHETLVLSAVNEEPAVGSKVVLLEDGNIEACITVEEVKHENDQIQLVGSFDDTLMDYFSYFRLEIQATEDMVEKEANAENLSTAVSNQYDVVKLGTDESGVHTISSSGIPYDATGKLNVTGDLNLKGNLKGEAEIYLEICWDKDFLPENTYFHMGYTVNTSPTVSFTLEYGKSFDGSNPDIKDAEVLTDAIMTQTPYTNGIHISLNKWGFNFSDSGWSWLRKLGENFVVESDFALEITGSISGKIGVEANTSVDIKYSNDILKGTILKYIHYPYTEHHTDIKAYDTSVSITAKGEASVFAGLKYSGKVKLAKLVDMEVTARMGATAQGSLEAHTSELWPDHACYLCCSGSGKPVADVDISSSVKGKMFSEDTEGKNVDLSDKFFKKHFEAPFDDLTVSGYYSLIHSAAAEGAFENFPGYFGVGKNTCPNKLTKVSFNAIGEDEEELTVSVYAVRSDGLWDSKQGSLKDVITNTVDNSAFFYPGTYTATAEYEGREASATFTVPDTTSVTLDFAKVDYYKYIRDELLPVMGYADLATLSDSLVINQYYNVGDWYDNEGILSASICDMNKDGVEDCILYYVAKNANTTRNEHSVFAQVYTADKGKIVPLGESCVICPVDGVSHRTTNVGLCEAGDIPFVYKQGYGYSMVAAGGQQPSIDDYFYGVGDKGIELAMFDTGSRYDYQIEQEFPAGLRLRMKTLPFKDQEFSKDNYNRETLEYLGFTDIVDIEYSCPESYHNLLNHKAHKAASIWGTSEVTPAFSVRSVEVKHDSKGGGHSTIETTLEDYTDLRKIISELPE